MLRKEHENVLVVSNEEDVRLYRDCEVPSEVNIYSEKSIDKYVDTLSKRRGNMYWEKWDYELFEDIKELYEELTDYYFFEMYNITDGLLPIKTYKLESHPDNKENDEDVVYSIKLILNLTDLRYPRLDFALYWNSLKMQEYIFKNFSNLHEMAKEIRKESENSYMFAKMMFDEYIFSENTCYEFVMHEGKRKIKLQERQDKEPMYDPELGKYRR